MYYVHRQITRVTYVFIITFKMNAEFFKFIIIPDTFSKSGFSLYSFILNIWVLYCLFLFLRLNVTLPLSRHLGKHININISFSFYSLV